MEKWSHEYRLALTEKLNTERVITSCINCENFDTVKEICRLTGTLPPARVVALGCPEWYERLPF